jgi:hypothetical protein
MSGLLLVGAGCDGNGDEQALEGGDLVLTDANNYTYLPTLGMADVSVASGVEATIDWSQLTIDIRGRAVDPAAIEQVYLVEFVDYTKPELIDLIESNDLQQEDTDEAFIFDNATGVTSATLTQFEILDQGIDLEEEWVEDDSRVWLVSLINHPDGANDVLQSKFITPLNDELNTSLSFTDDCTTLDVDVNMDDPVPAVVPDVRGNTWSLDWSAVTVDVNGRVWEPFLGDTLQIGHFDVASVADVEEVFLRLDSEADEFYTLDVFGKTGEPDLSAATDSSGAAFPGFTREGIWLVAIACKTCLSPAPLYLAVVDVP